MIVNKPQPPSNQFFHLVPPLQPSRLTTDQQNTNTATATTNIINNTMFDVSSSHSPTSPLQAINNPLIRPSSSSNPPSPPLEPLPFTPSEPGSATDDSFHYPSYPPSPAHQTDLSFLEHSPHFTYPASPLIPSHLPPPSFSAPSHDSTFILHLHDQTLAYPQPPYHHQWSSLPFVPRYYQNPHALVFRQNHSAFYNPSFLPPSAPISPFFHPPTQEFLGNSTELNTFEPFPIPHNTHIIPHQSNNLVPYTPSPPPSPSLTSTATLDPRKEENPSKPPRIPRSKKKRYPRTLSGTQQRICAECTTSSTPEWRSGPNGERNLCNRCGLRWRKAERSKKKAAMMMRHHHDVLDVPPESLVVLGLELESK